MLSFPSLPDNPYYMSAFLSRLLFGLMGIKKPHVFDYKFSGISVWIEPEIVNTTTSSEDYDGNKNKEESSKKDPTTMISKMMKDFAHQCGGPERGLHPFPAHCTLLYNMQPHRVIEYASSASNTCGEEATEESLSIEAASQILLEDCRMKYKESMGSHSSSGKLELYPTSLECFPYPPFACAISFLMFALDTKLERLFEVVSETFPPDARHSGSGTRRHQLQPHMSLVYAPMSETQWLMEETQRLNKNSRVRETLLDSRTRNPLPVTYLSVWSTEGSLDEWRCLARVKI